MISVVRVLYNGEIVKLFQVDGDRYSDEKLAKAYGLYGMDEDKIRMYLVSNPYLSWVEESDIGDKSG